ncbi:Prenylcysteine oxidase [Chionoecetes opilio]|uniref:Prenylcysteine oxidase n=1 Tax=Chionoecetes opilio TaxID=41210 RepID=A0A8J4YG01_CHIOP|nr:Prenylcysteine oxidase [Chionoecetes opilio]
MRRCPVTNFTMMIATREAEGPENALLYEAAKEAKGSRLAMEDATHDNKIAQREQEYDAVILATPLTHDKSKIHLANFSQQFSFPGHYEAIHTTLVRGIVRPESLMMNDDEMLDDILVTNPRLMFNSFGRQQPVEGGNCSQETLGVWKVFSPTAIPEDKLDIFFQRRELTHRVSWLAYPHYNTNETLGKFELAPGLYHLNAIEWAGSAMEMSVIGAKNVALLAYKYWMDDPDAGRKPPIKEEL